MTTLLSRLWAAIVAAGVILAEAMTQTAMNDLEGGGHE